MRQYGHIILSWVLLWALWSVLWPAPAGAEPLSVSEPEYDSLVLTAEGPVRTWEEDGTRVFVSEQWAEVRQGNVRLAAPRMVVWFDRKQSEASHVRAACVNVYAQGTGAAGKKPVGPVRLIEGDRTRSFGAVFLRLRSKAGFVWDCRCVGLKPSRAPVFYKQALALTEEATAGFSREVIPEGPEMEPPPGRPQVLKSNEQYVFTGEDRKKVTWVYLGDVRIRYKRVRIRADRAVMWADSERRTFEVYARGDVSLGKVPTEEPPEEPLDGGTLKFTRLFESLRADEVYINPDRERALAHGAELRLKQETPEGTDTYVLAGKRVYLLNANNLLVHEGTATTCNFGRPHYRLKADRLRVTHVEPSAFLTAWDTDLQVGEATLPFLPFIGMDLTGRAYILTRLSVGSSSKFGFYTRTGWSLPHLGVGPEWMEEWELLLDYYADRGPGAGTEAAYDLDWPGGAHTYGDLRGYYVRDTKEEDITGLPVPKDDRGRLWWQHRTAWDEHWTTDTELYWLSDRGFLDEYFEDEFETEKRPESYVTTRYVGGSTWGGLLFKKQVNHFLTQVEERPSAEIRWIGLPAGGFIYSGGLQAGYYDLEPGDSSVLTDTPALGRGHTFHRLSRPFSLGFLRFDPSVELLGTAASKSALTGGSYQESAEKLGGGGGLYASTDFFRSFDTVSETLNINRLRHVITPYAGFRSISLFNGESRDFIQMDRVDALDDTDRIEAGVRQRLQTKWKEEGGWRTVNVVELDVDFVDQDTEAVTYFDDDQFVEVDFILRPTEYVQIRSRNNRLALEGDTDIFNLGTWVKLGRRTEVAVDYDYITDVSSSLSAELFYRLSDRWGLSVSEKYEFDSEVDNDRKSLETEVHLLRQLHNWVLDIGAHRDEVNDDSGVTVGFRHAFMSDVVEGGMREYGREW